MAVSIDTVYQKVLAATNKEQRGYITPQEFNLFANQAQMEIFEQYFYDKNQYNRLPANQTQYADLDHMLEEKISIFKKREQPIRIQDRYGLGNLPTDVYRLDNVIRFSLTGVADTHRSIVEEVTEDELVTYERSHLAKPTPKRPIYIRYSDSQIKISPYSLTPSASAAWYFTNGAVTTSNSSRTVSLSTSILNYNFLEVGAYVYSEETPSHVPIGTTIESISENSGTATIVLTGLNSDFPGNWASSGGYELAFASPDIYCNYIRKPATVKWTYTVIAKKALYNSTTDTQDFELHASEENNLIYKILQLAGITLKDQFLTQAASMKEMGTQQQQKQ